jgi:dihydrofolate reductase
MEEEHEEIVANSFISLDGIIDGLEEWHFLYFNDEVGAAVDAVFSPAHTLLLGRTTYGDHAAAWPEREAAGDEDAKFQAARRRTQDRRIASAAEAHLAEL